MALLALALGIGATTAIFSVVYATLIAPLPFPHPEQLVMVWSRIQGFRNATAAGSFLDWKKQATAFQDLNAWIDRNVSLTNGGAPEQVAAQVTTPGLLSMMGHRMLLGRDFQPEEGVAGKDKVAILTHAMWQQRFGSDRDILGRDIRIDGRPHTVTGILAPGPADRLSTKMYLPMAFTPDQLNHDAHWLTVMGRLKPGNSQAADQAMRNHAVQYVSEPGFGWYRLRREWPSVYESHAELAMETWTKVRIEVAGRAAKLYLNGSARPSLVVDG